MIKNLLVFLAVVSLLFSIWTAFHAWRKDYKGRAVIIGLLCALSLLLQPIRPLFILLLFVPLAIAIISFSRVKPYVPNLAYIPNPKNFIGFGTVFYGKANKQKDGSFVTTEWFTLLYVPIVPIQSYRVVRLGETTKIEGGTITTTKNFRVFEGLPLNRPQVIKVYCFLISFFVFYAIMFAIEKLFGTELSRSIVVGASAGLIVVYLIIGCLFLKTR